MRYDPLRILRRLVLIQIARSLRRRLHILPRQHRSAHAHQQHNIHHLHHHPVCRSLRRRSRVRSTIHRRKHAAGLRTILADLGYPQPPTTILCDNTTAIGLANDNIKMKRSKAIDMRFHWIRDCVPGPRSPKPILPRLHPHERKHRRLRLHDEEPAEGTPRPVHLLPCARHHHRNNAMSHRAKTAITSRIYKGSEPLQTGRDSKRGCDEVNFSPIG
jgi:hypothetical protein